MKFCGVNYFDLLSRGAELRLNQPHVCVYFLDSGRCIFHTPTKFHSMNERICVHLKKK